MGHVNNDLGVLCVAVGEGNTAPPSPPPFVVFPFLWGKVNVCCRPVFSFFGWFRKSNDKSKIQSLTRPFLSPVQVYFVESIVKSPTLRELGFEFVDM